MTPADIRLLIAAASLSNGEAAEALATDDRRVRRWKSGDETPTPQQAEGLVGLAADRLSGQLMRALELAAGGPVEAAHLTVSPDAIALDGVGRLSAATKTALRAAFLARLRQRVILCADATPPAPAHPALADVLARL